MTVKVCNGKANEIQQCWNEAGAQKDLVCGFHIVRTT